MWRKLLLGLLSLPLLAATTNVVDTLYLADGVTKFSGPLFISWPTFQSTVDSQQHPAGTLSLQIVNGALNVNLEPTDATLPVGVYYTVVYRLVSGTVQTEYWLVPTSASPVGLGALRLAPVPPMSISIPWSQITANETNIDALGYAVGGGTAQAQTITLVSAVTSLTAGLRVRWLPANANSGAAPTLAVNGLTAKPITKFGTSAVVANDLTTTAIADAIYDGTEFQLLNPQTNTGGGGLTDGCAANQGHWEPWSTQLNTTNTMTANTLYGFELQVTSPLCTFTNLGLVVGTSSGHWEVTVWNASGTTALRSTTVQVPTGATDNSFSLASAFQFQSNTVYLITITTDHTGDQVYDNQARGSLINLAGTSTTRKIFTCANVAAWSGTNPNLPATCGNRSAWNVNLPPITFWQ